MQLVVGGKAFDLTRSETLRVSVDPKRYDSPDTNPKPSKLEVDA
ncbi:hypothetical protein [Paraburkholderia humisilvae]|uniref:Uncharacterized protein n=1 Tax=Paraburkholderia humisilvae TaxID=627669 RepID=A0A6J5F1N8_9BURK|nr:hypothetical protein [Paraburkholderia humisilvae]CAB3772264.1 hypothetical protein LMG29542_06833 [Paraburkholderia humisilvae]